MSGGGANLAVQGGQLQAEAFRTAGKIAQTTASYNAQLEKISFLRQSDALSREIMRFSSKNVAAAGASGLDIASKSFLRASDDALSLFERTAVDLRNTFEQRREGILYEGGSQRVNFENQARIAIFQGEVAAYQIKAQEAQAIGGLVGKAVGGIGGLFGGK